MQMQEVSTSGKITLFIPKDHFYAGKSVSTEVYTSRESGFLTLIIEQPFKSTQGQGYFEWQVTINGRCYAKCDGAISNAPTTVNIWHLPQAAIVELSLHAQRNSPRSSWEEASRIAVREVRFSPREYTGKSWPKITSDNPLLLALEVNAHTAVAPR